MEVFFSEIGILPSIHEEMKKEDEMIILITIKMWSISRIEEFTIFLVSQLLELPKALKLNKIRNCLSTQRIRYILFRNW